MGFMYTGLNDTWCPRFAWAYQQLVDVRYEWATRSDQRVNQPANSPVSDALFFLDGSLSANASTGPPDSLQYYLAMLEQNAVGSTNQKSLGSEALPILLVSRDGCPDADKRQKLVPCRLQHALLPFALNLLSMLSASCLIAWQLLTECRVLGLHQQRTCRYRTMLSSCLVHDCALSWQKCHWQRRGSECTSTPAPHAPGSSSLAL